MCRTARRTRRRICTGCSSTAWSIPNSGRYLSEDYAFCRRWRDIGGKIWVDLHCKLLHLGQHNFRGDLAESLRLQNRW